MSAPENHEDQKPVKWIEVHQEKSNLFRVVHADGAWLSVNPWNQVNLSFYSERYPIPKKIYFPMNKDGIVLSEDVAKRETKKDWFREFEVSVSLSVQTAKNLHEALGKFIALAEGGQKVG